MGGRITYACLSKFPNTHMHPYAHTRTQKGRGKNAQTQCGHTHTSLPMPKFVMGFGESEPLVIVVANYIFQGALYTYAILTCIFKPLGMLMGPISVIR